ncbi:MAG TPA: InlB B-repeat-containing protein [Bacteroidota bacterium]|nr:InlB B-repeat-containing protein [Bacteroidota bacterium]
MPNVYFENWFTSLIYTEEYDFDTPVIQDTTVYARWYYLIDFDVQGGEPELKIAPYYYGLPQKIYLDFVSDTIDYPYGEDLAEIYPTKDYHILRGWFDNPEGIGDKIIFSHEPNPTIVSGSMILYAVWDLDT